MIYLDTNIFVYSAINDKKKGELSRNILSSIVRGEKFGCTSLLTWDELFWAIIKERGRKIALKEGEKFLSFPKIILLETTKEIISLSQKLISKYSLKPRDAIHAATALVNNINEIVSDDPDFDKIEEIRRVKLEEFRG